MKFLSVASVAAILSATVSAGPLVPRDTCPKGYTQSVYYKTIYFEPSTSAVPESTATPSPTPVILESQTSVEPTLTPSSAAVVTSQAPAVEQVQSSTLPSAVAETSTSESAPIIALLPTSSIESLPAVETTSIVKAVEQTTQPAETTTVPAVKAVEQTTQTAETTTSPAPVAEAVEPTTSAAETTAAPVVKAAVQSTSTTSSTSSSSTSSSSSSSDSNSGEATFYGGNVSGGTCSFSGYSLPSTLFGTALSLARWDDAANCGRCVSVTGPKGNTVKAMVSTEIPRYPLTQNQNPI